jgi:hypothetical protein
MDASFSERSMSHQRKVDDQFFPVFLVSYKTSRILKTPVLLGFSKTMLRQMLSGVLHSNGACQETKNLQTRE